MKKKYFGGEYYFTFFDLFRKKQFDIEQYLHKKYPDKKFTFTGGGYYSILKIIDDIGFSLEEEILMPSYLCPSILIPFEQKKVKYSFYKVDSRLKIDINDILSKVNERTKAIFVINYFGFTFDEEVRLGLQKLKNKGVIILEDLVQSFFSNHEITGNYAFNSFRKYLPIDGSVIISDNEVNKEFDLYLTKYNFYKTIGQIFRYLTVKLQFCDFSKQFLSLFAKANENYHVNQSVGMSRLSKYLLSRQKVSKIIKNRREFFSTFAEKYESIALFKTLGEKDVPLGFPIIIKNREIVRKKLMELNIYCPVHWHIDLFKENEFIESQKLSNTILTIPLSFDKKDVAVLLSKLRRINENLS